MRHPDRTKNTSTPTNPPKNPAMPVWNATTIRTAILRSPSISGRKANDCCFAIYVLTGGGRHPMPLGYSALRATHSMSPE
jgi:hypothetical protein